MTATTMEPASTTTAMKASSTTTAMKASAATTAMETTATTTVESATAHMAAANVSAAVSTIHRVTAAIGVISATAVGCRVRPVVVSAAVVIPAAVVVAAVVVSPSPAVPGTRANEDAAREPSRAVVAIGRAVIWVIGVIAPLTDRGTVCIRSGHNCRSYTHSDSHRNLGVRRSGCKRQNQKHCQQKQAKVSHNVPPCAARSRLS